jgi:tetratricopeptide (TPR) repeat protein
MVGLLLMFAVQSIGHDVVVEGRMAADPAIECAKGACPPLRDAQLSIAYAEQQFREGTYRQALRTLSAALSRNRAFAKTDPRPVAALYQAYATTALHEGDMELYARAVGGQARTLRENLPATDPAVANAALALADMWVQRGDYAMAKAIYQSAERRASEQGKPFEAARAALRRAWVTAATGDAAQANRILAAVEEGASVNSPAIRAALPIMRLRIAVRSGDQAEIDRLVVGVVQNPATPPALIWAPPYDIYYEELASVEEDWADIGFAIGPDGHTQDAEVIRGSSRHGWTRPVLAQVRGRRYTPRSGDEDGPAVYRIERFSLRSTYATPTGSHVRRKAGRTELVSLDMSAPASSLAPNR